jgi:DNA-binding NarL/FixJ family response regulator
VRAVASKSVLDPVVVRHLMTVVSGGGEPPTPAAELTAREMEVLSAAARGFTNKAIGLSLGISDRTVQGHLRNIFEKLAVTNRTEAVVRAAQLGLLITRVRAELSYRPLRRAYPPD